MSRSAFEQIKSSLSYGGDFWNKGTRLRAIFADTQVSDVLSIEPITSGLWMTARVRLYSGAEVTRRYFS